MHYQIMISKGTNLWAFYDENGFMYEAEDEIEMGEKVRELLEDIPMSEIKVVRVMDTKAVIEVEKACPEPPVEEPPVTDPDPEEPGTPPDPEEPGGTETPPVVDPENPDTGGETNPTE